MDERQMYQWFILISEKERREIVADVPGSFTYGAVSMPARLPEQAKVQNTGLAWQLQGHYGRTAAAMIQAGLINAA